ncbi:MAG: YdeI/OmpD-associated family protein [Bacteroidia bacterium]
MPIKVSDASKQIDEAFDSFTGFQKQMCNHLRTLIHRALPEVKEDWKWGPNFNVQGMVCGVWGFKDHIKLVFFKGSMMKDRYKLFNQGSDNERSRSINICREDKIDDKKILEYLKEAAELNKKGVKPAKREIVFDMPNELCDALKKDKKAKAYFESLAPSYKRDYAEYIGGAKQPETRLRRLEKVMDMLADKGN